MKLHRFFLLVLAFAICVNAAELVHVDGAGVIRWNADQREVALFGANYSLASSCDYRAAGYVGADRKKLVEEDMTHFARMGWDAMRLCLWGDWENSDKAGNLIVNDHLDVMDYAIAQAKKRGVYILLTPITTYAAWWPDGNKDEAYPGFSKFFEKSELGTNPAAIAAQCNYLKQVLNHVNPYTGIALKDEPQILFVEMINEPWHHAEDFSGSVAYIDALAEAVRSTGCRKILFHNLSQDMRIASAIKTSTVPGVTFAWYPTGLNAGHLLEGNYLRFVDDYPPMLRPDLYNVPKIVYEFDAPDTNTAYMYPAMARAFRGVGAQFATMFSYDMLATAPYNLGWQTHFLNLVYSPKKAMSAVIAAEILRTLPRYSHFGEYPENRRFGPFRVNGEDDSSEMVTDEIYLYANGTRTPPPEPEKLRRIAGTGDSPIISYEGNGTYFLDRLRDGVWRLEVYPDAIPVQDPFAQRLNYKTVSSRLVAREWPMRIQLPDLGEGFSISGLNEGNHRQARADDGRFTVSPGVYLLSKAAEVDRATLPARVGQLGLTEFVAPPAPMLPPQVLPEVPDAYPTDQPLPLMVELITPDLPNAVKLHWRAKGQTEFKTAVLSRGKAYRYSATLLAAILPRTGLEWYVTATAGAESIRYPEGNAAVMTSLAMAPSGALTLFDAASDIGSLVYTRIGDTIRHGVFKMIPASATDPAALRLMFPLTLDHNLDDYTASLAVKKRIVERGGDLDHAQAVRIKARASAAGQSIFVTLVEADGTSWSKRVPLAAGWSDVTIPLSELRIAQGVKLPLGYPERWNYWLTPAKGRGGPTDHLNSAKIERVQISFRPDTNPALQNSEGMNPSADVASIAVEWKLPR